MDTVKLNISYVFDVSFNYNDLTVPPGLAYQLFPR